ncbi:MAG: nucleotidyl transferase AbiEii/AbiGii toxin family protein, partial [bacterium]
MIETTLNNIVLEKKRQGLDNALIKNILKEAIQCYVLDFIYNSPYGKNLIFCGGSCLRFCFELNRLSEDLDFDIEWQKEIDKEEFAGDILSYFQKTLNFSKIEAKISGREKKIYLKFPILYELGLAERPESEKLYVKVEIQKNISKYYQTEFTPLAKFNLNFIIKNYTFETLMASKIIAVMRRTFKKGKGDKITFKGRDYYDLLWFFQQKIKPDPKRIQDVLGISSERELKKMLWEKAKK